MKYKVSLTTMLESIKLLKTSYDDYLNIYESFKETRTSYINTNGKGDTNDQILAINEQIEKRMLTKINELASLINFLTNTYNVYKQELGENKKGVNSVWS